MAGGGEKQADGRVNGHIRRWRRYKAPKARRAGGILAETNCGGCEPIVIGRRRWRILRRNSFRGGSARYSGIRRRIRPFITSAEIYRPGYFPELTVSR